ncbi:S46 family peptidase [Lysobacter sp. HDW10]|uniref:S46 family peptidase n=1 Tax=Lysobacter sp. HDW10 TaxID=2714936 RepID=UPI0014080E30|nr:S46 family peptidase [Lysobacter sp. HDW10]QIK81356.1 S46 family peptidase [Lysobacter sp. HDW10]
MKISLKWTVMAMALTATSGAIAGEGMWVPQQLPEISAQLKKAGLKLDPKQLANLTGDPLGAIVSLGGCTASFVSPDGLVATNHHCAYGAIQLNSTAENNLIAKGFNAANMGDELSAGPGSRIFVLEQIDDVTAKFKAAIDSASAPADRTRAVEKFEKELISKCEAPGGYRCSVSSFFGGNTYRLFRAIEIKDVRLVYAPPGSIGNYGGEIDNWMWPRHTGDFSFIRAYVGRDGKPAAYSKDNVPYKPKHWLKFADKPLEAGDFVMVAGYPGSTNRYALVDEFQSTQDWVYPSVVQNYKDLTRLVLSAGKKNPDVQVKYANTVRGWENTMKNFEGQIAGFKRTNALATKQAEEAAVLAWLKKNGKSGQAALAAHEHVVALNAEGRKTRERDLVMNNLGGALGGVAMQLYRASIEREKPNSERDKGYQDRDYPNIEAGLKQMDRRYEASMDSAIQSYWLNKYVALDASQRIATVDAWVGGNTAKDVDAAVKGMHKSELSKESARLKWLKADRKAFESSKDPAIRYAVAMMPTVLQVEDERKVRAGEMMVSRPLYLKAVADYKRSKKQGVYPDANSTLRLTFGKVRGYTKLDGKVQTPFTRLEEVAAKATKEEPFNAPPELLSAISAKKYGGMEDKKLGTVPVNFLSDLDITGGNSGSPVLDANGKLVGLAFDGNWESVASNWVFDPVMTRMISVDQRYMRWIMQEVYPAPRLLKEMGVAKP